MDYKNAGVDVEAGYKSVELKEICGGHHASGSTWGHRRLFRRVFNGRILWNGKAHTAVRNGRGWDKA